MLLNFNDRHIRIEVKIKYSGIRRKNGKLFRCLILKIAFFNYLQGETSALFS